MCRIDADCIEEPPIGGDENASVAIKMLRRQSPGLRLLVSYADPEQGHHGGIYQGGNWIYLGHSIAQAGIIMHGKFTHKRTVSARHGTVGMGELRKI